MTRLLASVIIVLTCFALASAQATSQSAPDPCAEAKTQLAAVLQLVDVLKPSV